MNKVKLMKGNNLELLKKLPNNSIDSVVTDGPYGLVFMNKKWDYDVPSVEFWQEVYRVLKPGGHVLSFGGTRTYHRMVVNMEDAGFEIRDQIMWIYGSGFPKSHNIGKTLNDFEGWGTALKPANEPICLARKPLSEKSVAENVLKWKTGGINVDGCRVCMSVEDVETNIKKASKMNNGVNFDIAEGKSKGTATIPNDEGRFPANIILECCCDEVIKGEKGEVKKTLRNRSLGDTCYGDFVDIVEGIDNYNDKGDIHTNPECPCYIMDEQSGSASRFFYQAKVSKKERNLGLEPVEVFHQRPRREDGSVIYKEKNPQEWSEAMAKLPRKDKTSKAAAEEKLQTQSTSVKNVHPTVKPVNLLTYLCRMITPPNGIILDPFMGSGSTGIAAQLEGFRFCGMEMDEDYFKIAEARIENWEQYKSIVKK